MHYTTSCKHSLVLLRMGEIIARNMLSRLKLSINCYCLIWFVVYIIVSCSLSVANYPVVDLYTSRTGYYSAAYAVK